MGCGLGGSRAGAVVQGNESGEMAGDSAHGLSPGARGPAQADPGGLPPQRTMTRAQLPEPLAAIADPPARLFYQGDAKALSWPAVAIVGSRRCTRQGAEVAFALARDLAQQGINIVSGLAYGIDAAAHRGALAAGGDGAGVTVAVLGGGLGNLYPRGHAPLAREIVAAGGALVSEYEALEPPRKHHFPARNRIVSGLCLGVIIVEASVRSGSLITARMALEQGRDVMAVPSLVSSPLARGGHRLIREGAALVECAEHVLEALGLPARAPAPVVDDAVLAAVQASRTSVEAITHATGLPLEEVLRRLTELEVDGAVAAHNGGYIRLPGGAQGAS